LKSRRLNSYETRYNHYHLLLETPEPNLARGMRHLKGVYTQRFNRRHGRVGHVFQGRYKAIVVQKDVHLVELGRYVVLNPVRAGLVAKVGEWPWSSYRATVGHRSPPAWLTVAWLWAQFSHAPQRAVRAYRRFVAAGEAEAPWQALTRQIYYGDETFVTKVAKAPPSRAVPRRQRQPVRPGLAHLLKAGTPEEVGIAYRKYGYGLGEMAQQLGVHYSTVSRRLHRFEQPRRA
jgi:putative transposase